MSDEAPEYPQLASVMERIPELEEDPEEAWVVVAAGASAVVVVGLEGRNNEGRGWKGKGTSAEVRSVTLLLRTESSRKER